MTKHTPGPWYKQGTYIGITPTGRRFLIGEVYQDNGVEQAQANARLIASAPELLFACKALLAYIVQDETQSSALPGEQDGVLWDARSAIRKATGE